MNFVERIMILLLERNYIYNRSIRGWRHERKKLDKRYPHSYYEYILIIRINIDLEMKGIEE